MPEIAIFGLARVLLLAATLAVAAHTGNAAAQSGTELSASEAGKEQQARLDKVFSAFRLPLTKEFFDQLNSEIKRNVAANLLKEIGSSANLGEEWRNGNPQFEQAKAILQAATDKLFESAGNVETPKMRNVRWNEDDLQFVENTLQSPFGVKFVEATNDTAVLFTVAVWNADARTKVYLNNNAREIGHTAEMRLRQLISEADAFGKGHEQDMRRLTVLFQSMNKDLQAASMAPMMTALNLASDLKPQMNSIIAEYRRAQGAQK